VNYIMVDGTALAGTDYTTSTGTLTFTPREAVAQTITVPIISDIVNEPVETFQVQINTPTFATILVSAGTGTITDNDPPPTVAFSQKSPYIVFEKTSPAVITVNLSRASGFPITVNYSTSDGTAKQGIHYTASSGTLSFPPGSTSQTFNVPVINNNQNDPDLTVKLTLTAPANATFGDPITGILFIKDEDPQPVISIDNVSQNEGNVRLTNFIFNVTLATTSGNVVTVDYTTINGTALAGSDYVLTAGTLTFKPGEVTKSITVPVIGDINNEEDEAFAVILSNPINAIISTDTGIGTIYNDDLYRQVLPLIMDASQPDLIVTSFKLTPSKTNYKVGQAVLVTIQLKNVGNASTGPFWVDFYINPSVAPTSSNIPWSTVCGMNPCYGIAWEVKNGVKSGETITLTSTSDSYSPNYTIWYGSLPYGTHDLYVYLDSWGGASNPNGAITEVNEGNNRGEIHGLQITN
jgi:Calx-beta domain/CARDB